ncbi:MAG TPA: transcription elongation factor GreB [Polyangium sp.]|jgi:transcription elongation factor GreB|nr:transcription elongation factor GreB [Polyangium sp.]
MANPNYITPDGAKRLSEELGRLRSVDRPRTVQEVADAAAQGDRSENAEYIYGKKKLREIDRRMRYLTKRLESAVVVDPKAQKGEKVFFGATIEVIDEDDKRAVYRIVGEDETDSKSGAISWRSPVGGALLGKTVGDVVVVQRPAGAIELEIVKISYV